MTPKEQFNQYLFECFSTPTGQRALVGLTNLVGQVLEPTATDAELRHREGQRSIVAMIMKGMQDERDRRRDAVGSAGTDGTERRRGPAGRQRSAGRGRAERGA